MTSCNAIFVIDAGPVSESGIALEPWRRGAIFRTLCDQDEVRLDHIQATIPLSREKVTSYCPRILRGHVTAKLENDLQPILLIPLFSNLFKPKALNQRSTRHVVRCHRRP